jgi:hypothetical protein
MDSFKSYLPVVYPLTQAKLLLYVKGEAIHLVLVTAGNLYRHIIDDIQEFKEDVGYAFNDTFTVVCLNSLKDLTLKLQPEKATIVVILAKREVTIVLDAIDRANCLDMIGLMGVTNTIPELLVEVPMEPPALPNRTPKRKRNEHVLQYRRKRKK